MHIDYRNLRNIRLQKGLRLGEVAKACGFSIARLYNYETGYRRPTSDALIRLLEFYGITHTQLLSDESKRSIEEKF
jgi:transcriptional regulator with XRE-family HTH domain